MGAKTKRVRKIRDASEFDIARLRAALAPPMETSSVYSWTLAEIMGARDAQMRGQFAQAARLAASMRTDDALAVARANRLAPQRCIKVEIVAVKGARGKGPASEAEALYGQDGVALSPGTRADINGCLVDHGVAFACNVWTVRDDGTRTDVEVRYWPIEHVRWDALKRCFVTRVGHADDERTSYSTSEEPIIHGDGRWIVFSTHDHEPFKQEAAVLAGALVWARHAYAIRDWSKSSVAHGSAKVVGALPEGVALQKAGGGLTDEAAAMAELLRAIASSDAPAGIKPAGSSVDFLTNNSTAWQIWTELVGNAEKAAARIYLGTDGTLGAQGGAPGVDISQLFGVALTKVQGDLGAISRGLQTGSVEIWTAINFGDSSLAPTRRYMIPDADADADRASLKTRTEAFFAHLALAREAGAEVDQKFIDELADLHDVKAFKLKPTAVVAPAATTPAPAPALKPAPLHAVSS